MARITAIREQWLNVFDEIDRPLCYGRQAGFCRLGSLSREPGNGKNEREKN
jgi:hypothetical protein